VVLQFGIEQAGVGGWREREHRDLGEEVPELLAGSGEHTSAQFVSLVECCQFTPGR